MGADTLAVDPLGGGDFTEIQAAIEAASDGDRVLVKPGEYRIEEPIRFRGKSILVRSERGPRATVIRMSDAPIHPDRSSVVVFEDGETEATRLEGFTLTGGRAENGGGVYVKDSSPTLANCAIAGNLSEYSGGGVFCTRSSLTLVNCTIAGNAARSETGGLACYHSTPSLLNCIVWDNAGGSVHFDRYPGPKVTYCCIEGDEVWPGIGNIHDDPGFCGWGAAAEVHVDSSRSGPGDGTAAHPYADLAMALDFSLALSSTSPCLGTGEGGSNRGADMGVCGAAGGARRLIHLAPGTYSIRGLTLAHGASLRGAGEEETVVEGTVAGLRTGAVLSDLTVTRGLLGGIWVASGDAPEILRCTLNSARSGGGVLCGGSPALTNCAIMGNRAEQNGGGAFCLPGSTPAFTNCTIAGNEAERGVGVHCESSSPVMTNCIISDDVAASSCGGLSHCVIDEEPLFVRPGVFVLDLFVTAEVGSLERAFPDLPAIRRRPGRSRPAAWTRRPTG